MPNKQRHILLVEDHNADVELTRKAFEAVPYPRMLHVAIDGIEAMNYLRKKGRFATCPTPDLILLDLNMPRKSGREVLQEIRQDSVLRTIPVIVLTTSASEQDVTASYNAGANAYVVKPFSYAEFVKIIKTIDTFWFGICQLPGIDSK